MRATKKRQLARTVAIVGDGFTEKIYFEQLKEEERLRDVVIKPELPNKNSKGGGYKKVMKTAEALVDDGYDHVYCLIDLDTVLTENKLNAFKQELRNIDRDKITVYINNPCFETWILAHYVKTGGAFANCDAVVDEIVKNLEDYGKKQEYLKKKRIYKVLRPALETHAIPHAEFLEKDRDDRGDRYPRAEVFKFFLEEKIITKEKNVAPEEMEATRKSTKRNPK
jgi:hypothetical protein